MDDLLFDAEEELTYGPPTSSQPVIGDPGGAALFGPRPEPFPEEETPWPDISKWLTEQGVGEYEALQQLVDSTEDLNWKEWIIPQGVLLYVIAEFNGRLFYFRMVGWERKRLAYIDFYTMIASDLRGTTPEPLVLKKKVPAVDYLGNDAGKATCTLKLQFVKDHESSFTRFMSTDEIIEQDLSKTVDMLPVYAFRDAKTPLEQLRQSKKDHKYNCQEAEVVTFMKMFSVDEQEEFYEDDGLTDYVKRGLSSEEAAWAITPHDISVISPIDKLKFVGNTQAWVDYEAIRSIIRQHPKGHSLDLALTYGEEYEAHDDIELRKVIEILNGDRDFPEYEHNMDVLYNDLTDTSQGMVGMNTFNLQMLLDVEEFEDAQLAYRKGDEQGIIDAGYEDEDDFEEKTEEDKENFIKFFQRNALKMAFYVLNLSEQAIYVEMERYMSGVGFVELERDMTAMSGTLESLYFADRKRYASGVLERGVGIADKEKEMRVVLKRLAPKHPYLFETELDFVNIYNYYKTDPTGFKDWLYPYLEEVLARNLLNVQETRSNLRDDPELIWDFEQLIAVTHAWMNLGGENATSKNDVYRSIIAEKVSDVAQSEMLLNLGLALGVIVLGLLSAGLGWAAGAGVLGVSAGLASASSAVATIAGITVSAIDFYKAYQDYTIGKAAANINAKFDNIAGLTANDPSIVWLVVACVGLGLDMVGVVGVLKSLKHLAKGMGSTSDIPKLGDEMIEIVEKNKKQLKLSQEQADGLKGAINRQVEIRQKLTPEVRQKIDEQLVDFYTEVQEKLLRDIVEEALFEDDYLKLAKLFGFDDTNAGKFIGSSGKSYSTPASNHFDGEDIGKYPQYDEIKYLDETERIPYEVKVKDGRLYTGDTPLDSVKNEKIIYVMDGEGRIYAGGQKTGSFHHSSFLSGEEVAAAGELAFDGNKVFINLKSGHYTPESSCLNSIIEELIERGVGVQNIEIGNKFR